MRNCPTQNVEEADQAFEPTAPKEGDDPGYDAKDGDQRRQDDH
jgi:hypothetical protein